ncbi:MAG: hypothetical protein JO224_11010 [Pelomonas sp.]|nr:hypothetical protein [Roseateles sp.]
MPDAIVDWLAAYTLHSTALIALVWAAERAGSLRRLAHAELAWRWALFGPLLTASLPLLIASGAAPMATDAPASARSAQPAVAAQRAQVETRLAAPRDTAATPRPMAPQPVATPTAEAAPAATAARTGAAAPADDAPSSLPWHAIASAAALLWLVGALAGLALLAGGALWLAAAVRRLPRRYGAEVEAQALALSRRAGLRAPALRGDARWQSPLLTPGGTICLPAWTEALAPAQREAVLAHELAHLRRRDPAWRAAGQAVVRLAWLQPLNRVALARLDTLAELACDAWAARLTGGPLPLAECLLRAAEQAQGRRTPRLAAAMSRRRSPLAQRLERLLEGDAMNDEKAKPLARKTRWIVAACVLTAAVAVPAVIIRGSDANADELFSGLMANLGGVSTTIFKNDGVTRIETRNPDGSLRIDVHGKLQFSDADDQLTGVDGKLEVRDTHGGHKRHLVINGQPGAPLQRQFERDGAKATMDADDEAWFKGIVDLLVQSVVNPDEQVRRLLAHGGVPAVLARIDHVGADFARSALIQALVRSGPQDAATLGALIERSTKLGSDYDRRMCLQAIAGQPLDAALQAAWLQSLAGVNSDYDQRTALAALAPQLATSPAVIAAWQAAVARIHSDFDARTAIETQLQASRTDAAGKAPPALVTAALEATQGVHSDFDRRTALATIATRLDRGDAAQVHAYADTAAAINSDFDRREALVALVSGGPLKPEGYGAVLGATASIGSSFDTLNVLNAVAERMPADAALIAQYRRVARRLPDFERGQAERALDHLDQT